MNHARVIYIYTHTPITTKLIISAHTRTDREENNNESVVNSAVEIISASLAALAQTSSSHARVQFPRDARSRAPLAIEVLYSLARDYNPRVRVCAWVRFVVLYAGSSTVQEPRDRLRATLPEDPRALPHRGDYYVCPETVGKPCWTPMINQSRVYYIPITFCLRAGQLFNALIVHVCV